MRVILNEASGLLKARFGAVQEPIAAYITKKAETIEQEEKAAFQVFSKRKSKHFAESYRYETEMEDMRPVGENGAYPIAGFQEGFAKTINNVTYKNSFGISREMMDDDVIGNLGQKPDKLLRSYYRGRARELAAAVGNALQGNAKYTYNGWNRTTACMDGLCVFSKQHPLKVKGGTQSNLYADAFSEGSLFAGITAMQNLKDDDGNTLAMVPDTLIIPNVPALKLAAFKLIGSDHEPGSGNNAINPIYGNLQIVVWGYLNDFIGSTNTAPWILLDSRYNEENNGNIYQDRIDLEVSSELGNNDENLWKAYARYGYGFVDFRQMMAFGIAGGSNL